MIFGIITQVFHFYLNKNYFSSEGDYLWICHTPTLTCSGYDTKGIKQAWCKQLCKKYDVVTNDYVWNQPINMIADPLDLHVFFNDFFSSNTGIAEPLCNGNH